MAEFFEPPREPDPTPPPPEPSWQAHPNAPAPGPLTCRFCGSTPAAAGRFRAHQGFIVVMRFIRLDGPFCRDCGIATFRRMTAQTLLLGWWGFLSFFITPATVLLNLARRGRFARLGPPQRDFRGSEPMPEPMQPGRPLYARPAILGLLVPVVVAVVAIASANAGNAPAQMGKCVAVTASATGGQDTADLVGCDRPHVGKVIEVAESDAGCPDETIGTVEWDDGKVLCVGSG
jgi:hypothetical protein